MQNRFGGENEDGQTTKKRAKTTQENDVNGTLYLDAKGTIYQPAECIRQALINAGKAFKKGRSSLTKTVASFVDISPEAIPHLETKWETDRRAVVIPSTKGRVMRNRARFNEWELEFTATILDVDEINEKTMNDLLVYAGNYLGIGDYRPEKKGMFGRFMVVSFKESK